MISSRKKIVIMPQKRQREKNVAVSRKKHSFRNDAHNFSRYPIDVQSLSNHERETGETTAPESLADECDLDRAGNIILVKQIAAGSRTNSQYRQIVGRYAGRTETLRWAAG